jgi:hypothetical protein
VLLEVFFCVIFLSDIRIYISEVGGMFVRMILGRCFSSFGILAMYCC